MNPLESTRNGVAAIRASSIRQGTDGDSPEAQREQLERYAQQQGITIKKIFVFLESASKDQQPMQEVIDYCTNPANEIDLVLIKSIDRFTRGGTYAYDFLKMQLEKVDISLVDVYGVISHQKINTLEHLGLSYSWSTFSPSRKSELLEAERAKDEMRDIMSRVIGAEIRYARIGYWMRQPPYGYASEKVETQNGKRCLLAPHPTEAAFIRQMYELCARGTMDDHQIAEEMNRQGFMTRSRYIRDDSDKTKIIGQRGKQRLTAKRMRRMIERPIYAGVIKEKWTEDKPIMARFEGLVSFDLYNRANSGRLTLVKDDSGTVHLHKEKPLEHLVNKGVRNPDFPYKKAVACSKCGRALLGSSSRGKSGKYYPGYHCSNHGHYFRVSAKEFEKTIESFVQSIKIDPAHLDDILGAAQAEWENRQLKDKQLAGELEARQESLRVQVRAIVDKMQMISSETAIKYMEEDIVKLEEQITHIDEERRLAVTQNTVNTQVIIQYVKYFMEHLDQLLLHLSNPVNKANYFAVLFEKTPTYQEIKDGTLKIAQIPGVNELFKVANCENELMVTPRRIELRLPG